VTWKPIDLIINQLNLIEFKTCATDPPVVRIELGSNIHQDSIREGSDVYFECRIDANPYVSEIQWFFNDRLLASSSNGILIANHSLGTFTS
jgi:hypothetical protein